MSVESLNRSQNPDANAGRTISGQRIDPAAQDAFLDQLSDTPPQDDQTSLAGSHQRLIDDLHRFINGEIDALALEQSLIDYQESLDASEVGSSHTVEDGNFLMRESRFSEAISAGFESALGFFGVSAEDLDVAEGYRRFSAMTSESQTSFVQNYLDAHSPITIFGDRLIDTLDGYRSGEVSAQELEVALIDFHMNRGVDGIEVSNDVRDGQYLVDNRNMPNASGYTPGGGEYFSTLTSEEQAAVAARVVEQDYLNSAQVNRDRYHLMAAEAALPDSSFAATRIAEQTVNVQNLLDRLTEDPGSRLTSAEERWLADELTELARLRTEAGLSSRFYSYRDQNGGELYFRYTRSNPPPHYHDRQIEHLADSWSQSVRVDRLSRNELVRFASRSVDELASNARAESLEHQSVLGQSPVTSPVMRWLLNELGGASGVPADVDTELMFQVNMASAQVHLSNENLQRYEYRLTDAARAVLGDQGWGQSRESLWGMYRWIEQGPVMSHQHSRGRDGEEELVPRSEGEMAFSRLWENTSREDRIEFFGLDVETWDKAAPLLEQSMNAHNERKSGEFGLDDLVKLGMGMFISYATANALGPAVAGWLGSAGVSSGVAGVAGTAVGAAGGTLLSTLIMSGDWVTAREAFLDVFEGDLKEGLAELVLARFGLDSRYARLIDASTSNDLREELTRQLGMDLLENFGAPLIDRIQEFTPDAVDAYLDDLSDMLTQTDDPDMLAEHAIAYWGSELSGVLGITNQRGIRLMTALLDRGVNYGDLDVDALRSFFGTEIETRLADLPQEVVERLGGSDSAMALIAGVATRIAVDNIDVAVEGGSFSDAAAQDLEEFVESIAEDWVEQGGLENILEFLPRSREWSSDFRELLLDGHNAGWNRDTVQELLSDSSLITNIINSYVPGGVAYDMLSQAVQYASDNGWDTQQILNAATVDVLEIVGSAGISQDIVSFFGGQPELIQRVTNVFGERLLANNGDIDQTLEDMRAYARGLAAGHVGDFTQSILAQVLGPNASQAINALSGLAEGHAAGWSDQQLEDYIQERILDPLGETGAGGLLGAVTEAYIASPGNEDAARTAALDFLYDRLSGLAGGSNFNADDSLALPPSPSALSEAIGNLIAYAQDNDWNRDAIATYVEDQFLNHELGSTLITSMLGGTGNRAQLAGVLVEELVDVWQATEDPVKVTEHFVEFLLNPPSIVTPTDGSSGTSDAGYGVDNDGNIVDFNTFRLSSGVTAGAAPIMNLDDDQTTAVDTGSNTPIASYTSAMQAVFNSDQYGALEKLDVMFDMTRFYAASWAEGHQAAADDSLTFNQNYWREQSNLDPNLNRAMALLGRVGHNLYQVIPDTQSLVFDRRFREEAGAALYQLVSEPEQTAAQIAASVDQYADLPVDQQVEKGIEFLLTGVVGAGGLSVGSRAFGMRSDVSPGTLGNIDFNPMAAQLTGRIRITDDIVYIPRPSFALHSTTTVFVPTGEVYRIQRLSEARNSEIDMTLYRDPFSNYDVYPEGARMSIDHILPLQIITNLDGFDRLTREQMENLIQDRNGDIDNLMALPLSLNISKNDRLAHEWEATGFESGTRALDEGYVRWLAQRQQGVLARAERLIAEYLGR